MRLTADQLNDIATDLEWSPGLITMAFVRPSCDASMVLVAGIRAALAAPHEAEFELVLVSLPPETKVAAGMHTFKPPPINADPNRIDND